MFRYGAILAISSAALFGISPVLAKLIIGDVSPVMLAGLFYLGSGLGLQIYLLKRHESVLSGLKKLAFDQKLKLIGSILCGGILGPLCFTFGIQKGSAFEVSLLLNIETVATSSLAWMVFREHVGKRVWIAKTLLVMGAVIVTVHPASGFILSKAALLILGACFFWGIDNNLTRDIEDLPPAALAGVKGWLAGSFNILLALMIHQAVASVETVLISLLIGALCYGLSLVFFIKALREIGSARVSTYFAIAPFFGMLASLILLKEHPSAYQWLSLLAMGAGLWVLYGERHEHVHQHEPMEHRHLHIHDEHHQHAHDGSEGPEPHEHWHEHEALTHSHVHYPDIHHRHQH